MLNRFPNLLLLPASNAGGNLSCRNPVLLVDCAKGRDVVEGKEAQAGHSNLALCSEFVISGRVPRSNASAFECSYLLRILKEDNSGVLTKSTIIR